jgi:hypothetical protein
MYGHPCRTTFCLSATRHQWLQAQALTLKVLSDNGADVFINGVQVLADAASNHNPVYWNSVLSLAGDKLVAGEAHKVGGPHCGTGGNEPRFWDQVLTLCCRVKHHTTNTVTTGVSCLLSCCPQAPTPLPCK